MLEENSEKIRNRSWRRSQSKRVEASARKKLRYRYICWETSPDEVSQNIKRLKNNLANCSCPSCGNPRKWWKEITMQEKKAKGIFHTQLEKEEL